MPLMQSWVASANTTETDFPLNNLPLGVFSRGSSPPRCGVAIGDMILDVTGMEEVGLLRLADTPVLLDPGWNRVMVLGPEAWARLRILLVGFLAADAPGRTQIAQWLVPQAEARMHLPFAIGDLTQSHLDTDHAPDVRNGRISSVVISGTAIRRPLQLSGGNDPVLAPAKKVDASVKLGAVIGRPARGPVTATAAADMIFGHVLLNDWTAMQNGTAQVFATTMGPWIVMREALDGFRTTPAGREAVRLPHLAGSGAQHYELGFKADLLPGSGAETRAVAGRHAALRFTAAQQIAHLAASGCMIAAGDLIGSAPVDAGAFAALADGDTVLLQAFAEGKGYRIGFGPCEGKLLPGQPPT